MDMDEVRQWLFRFDQELSFLEEETDLDSFYEYGGRENPRAKQAEEAKKRKTEINTPEGVYTQLIT